MASIVSKTKKNSSAKYYYYSHSYRVKVDSRGDGKAKGSGKSRVVTNEVYLGTAEDVVRKCQASPEPLSIQSRSFGLECSALAVAQELDLIGIIDRSVQKRHQGLSIGQYLVIAAINRIARPTSRMGIAGWFEKTVLGEKMHISPDLLKSQNFWDAFDKVLSQASQTLADDSKILRDVEDGIWGQLLQRYQIHLDPILYDTTNFFTFLDPQTPSELARFCRSKDGKKNRKCVGLGLGLTRFDGFPLFHLVYAANQHDSKLFPTAIRELTRRFSEICRSVKGATLVMDKGNNSAENIQLASAHKLRVVGSLVPSQNPDLMAKPLGKYLETVCGCPVYRETRMVFGVPGVVVVTFHEKLKKRQMRRLEERMSQAERQIRDGFAKRAKKDSKERLEKQLSGILKASGVGSCLNLVIAGRRYKTLHLTQNKERIKIRKQAAGKTIHFSTDPGFSSREVVTLYRSRSGVEETFKLEKDPEGVPFRPIFCWTDSKIRVYSFVCVLALLIWRLMQYKLRQAGLKMSDDVLRKELGDLKEVALMYSPERVIRKITDQSTVQREICSLLSLHRYFPK